MNYLAVTGDAFAAVLFLTQVDKANMVGKRGSVGAFYKMAAAVTALEEDGLPGMSAGNIVTRAAKSIRQELECVHLCPVGQRRHQGRTAAQAPLARKAQVGLKTAHRFPQPEIGPLPFNALKEGFQPPPHRFFRSG